MLDNVFVKVAFSIYQKITVLLRTLWKVWSLKIFTLFMCTSCLFGGVLLYLDILHKFTYQSTLRQLTSTINTKVGMILILFIVWNVGKYVLYFRNNHYGNVPD